MRTREAEIARLQASARAGLEGHRQEVSRLRQPGESAAAHPADLQKLLTADEALLSFYFGRFDSFVWVLRKDGPVQFARLDTRLGDIERQGDQASRGAGTAMPR